MTKGLPKYKYEKLSTESILNAVRLHLDAILLYKNNSFPTAFHLAVLTLEEIAKSDWLDHYVDSCETNHGFPDHDEQHQYLQLLYVHTAKQFAFINQQFHELSPNFYDFVASRQLEYKKQKSIYVGLEREKGKVNTKSKISKPTQIKLKDAKQLISLNHSVLISLCKRNEANDYWYGPIQKYCMMNKDIRLLLETEWTHKSGLLSGKWIKSRWKKSNA